MLDTVPCSALAAVALQWYTRLNYMAKQNFGIIVGGSLIKKEKFDELTRARPEGPCRHQRTRRQSQRHPRPPRRQPSVRVADQARHDRGRHLAHKAAWDAVAKQTRENLTGRVYSKSLLEAVEKAVANN